MVVSSKGRLQSCSARRTGECFLLVLVGSGTGDGEPLRGRGGVGATLAGEVFCGGVVFALMSVHTLVSSHVH